MNIVLIGMRGSGKSTIGEKLSETLHRPFIEIDVLVEQKMGKSIQEIVKDEGWEGFRDAESQAILSVVNKDGFVIASGGGSITRGRNSANLKKNGFIIYLTADPLTLEGRVGFDPNRPFLTHAISRLQDIQQVYKQRRKRYEQAADLIVNTQANSIEEAILQITIHLKEKKII